MKHVWAGTALMAALLCAGILLTVCMDRMQDTISQELKEAAGYALEENWEEADALAGRSALQWQRNRRFVASVVDHGILEEVEGLFSELAVYRAGKYSTEYAVTSLCLARRIEAVGESQSLCWWHLL